MQDFLAFISKSGDTLIGGAVALVSSLGLTWLQNHIGKKNFIRDLKRDKLETLYVEVKKLYDYYDSFFQIGSLLVSTTITLDIFMSKCPLPPDMPEKYNKSEIIIPLYFDEITADYEEFKKAIGKPLTALYKIYEDRNTDIDLSDYIKKMAEMKSCFIKLDSHFKKIARDLR